MSDPSQSNLCGSSSSGEVVGDLCVVAIARDETPFIDEWIAYHAILGVNHFYIYDDDAAKALKQFLEPHGEKITVVNWFEKNPSGRSKGRQIAAYEDAFSKISKTYRWAAFLDIDEFMVLQKHADLKAFLADFAEFAQVSLHRHVFGHNGYFDDPKDFITSALVRRMAAPGKWFRSIVKCDEVQSIASAYQCVLRSQQGHVDTNKRPWTNELYPGKTAVANINHYSCRSFRRWMQRPDRGSVVDDVLEFHPENYWKHNRAECLRRFVELIAKNRNELVDDYLAKYRRPIKAYLEEHRIGVQRVRKSVCLARVKGAGLIDSGSVVVYTAFSRGYDSLSSQFDEPIEYVAFLEEHVCTKQWKVKQLESHSGSPNRDAKRYKALSHHFFPDKQFSLWLDGSVQMNVSILTLIEKYLGDFDMVVHRHPDRDCTFMEAAACKSRGLDDPKIIDDQIARYRREAYPMSAGLYENRVILRRHNDRVRAFNELWWDEIQKGSKRDQLSSTYVARRVGLKVGYFPGSLRHWRADYNGLFTVNPHLIAAQSEHSYVGHSCDRP